MNELFVRLAGSPAKELERLMRSAPAPELGAIAGFEWAGWNTPLTSQLLGIRKFIKVFTRGTQGIEGYNLRVSGHDIDEPWLPRGARSGAKIGYYRVFPPGAHSGRYRRSALIDYGTFPDQHPVVRSIRDFVVQPVSSQNDVLLGKAFLTLGSASVPAGYFILERSGAIQAE